jgi:2-phospho-L-lactate guanylyltransferase
MDQPRNGAPEHTLNHALRQATGSAQAHGADAVLILPADLPRITPDDITQLVRIAETQATVDPLRPCMVIAPSQDGGTNALLLRPPTAIDFAFGPDSFQRHRAQAAAVGASCHVVHAPGLAFDLDRPRDLSRWRSRALP